MIATELCVLSELRILVRRMKTMFTRVVHYEEMQIQRKRNQYYSNDRVPYSY